MAEKCVHQGCGKLYTDPEEVCVYHPGPPVFHEGQKEFLAIPPCTEGKHSTTDLPPKVEQKEPQADGALVEKLAAASVAPTPTRKPIAPAQATPAPPPPAPESEDDDPALAIPADAVCRRKPARQIRRLPATAAESCVPPPRARYRAEVPLFAPIDTAKSSFKVLGTKLEVTFVKADGASWPVLRSDDRLAGEILQIGKAGVAQR
ncbi:CORD and CS domain-containing protein [Verticillium alfalfae VaMs.102]|uniref:CORD and CS domain-containing protein n=1 Tax=Verticillium alfalfae (strain VaMs.102 / ATCC MYA-4576 / FGSC 10136) TaxID=526221 RepID=C9SIG8_VERA1|nr:CORD and CS domain-containing protein [Verticillium alfalfae VaMs.102]EEY18741.1 CORD and CS domain-containing protein [Verticillium alfalfae VaMs.102]